MTYKVEIVTEKSDDTLKLNDKIRIGGKLFLEGFLNQAKDESTAGTALAAGLWSGLKYKGNIKRGIRAGILTELTFCTANGVRNVLKNYRKTKRDERKYLDIHEEVSE